MRFFRKVWMAIAIATIIFAIVFSLFRALTPWVGQYHAEITHQLQERIGEPVSIGQIETGWYRFYPVLKLYQIKIGVPGNQLTVGSFQVGLDFWRSLWNQNIQLGLLYLKDISAGAHPCGTGWCMDALTSVLRHGQSNALDQLLLQSASFKKIIIKDTTLMLRFPGKVILPLEIKTLMIARKGNQLSVQGSGHLKQAMPAHIDIRGRFIIPYDNDFSNVDGQLYFSLRQFALAQWQHLLSYNQYRFLTGVGTLESWIDIEQSQAKSLQAKLSLDDFVYQDDKHKQSPVIQNLSTNIIWDPKEDGWALGADKIRIRVGNVQWPQNNLIMRYKASLNNYYVYLDVLNLDNLSELPLFWSRLQDFIKTYQLHGVLKNVQATVQKGKPISFSGKFHQLGWAPTAKNVGVSNLSGAVSWQPEIGRIAFDSKAVQLTTLSQLITDIDLFNAALSWQKHHDKLRLMLEHSLIQSSDLKFGASGVVERLDDGTKTANLKGQMVAEDAEKWLAYLPKNRLKPKLEQWLKDDIKTIRSINTAFSLDGNLAAFPFDHGEGKFILNGWLKGVDLQFTSKWPLTRDIDGFLTLKNRDLTVDIIKAKLDTIPISAFNMRIDDIGHDKEQLLIHGKLETTGEKAQDYIKRTPIHDRLKRLDNFDIHGKIGIDLQSQIPLYPTKQPVLAKGSIEWQNNEINIQDKLLGMTLQEVDGKLYWNERQITSGVLRANIMDEMFDISVQENPDKYQANDIRFYGKIKPSRWISHYHIPADGLFSGKTTLTGELIIGRTTRLELNTNWQGVTINMPTPIGKQASTLAPSNFKLYTDGEKITQLGFDMQNLIKAETSLVKDDGAWRIDSGNAQFGGGAIDWRYIPNAWEITLKQPMVTGLFNYSSKDNLLKGQVSHLYFEHQDDFSKEKPTLPSIEPSWVPKLALNVEDLQVNTQHLGQLMLKSHSQKGIWVLDNAELIAPNYQLSMQGQWAHEKQSDTTNMTGYLQFKDLSDILQQFSIEPLVEAARGEVRWQGTWPDTVYNFSLSKTSAGITTVVKDGLVTHLSPETEEKINFGKLLSILSLQTIPRRLKLDFRDLSNKGYTFDEFQSNFELKKGILVTNDAEVNGPVARVSLRGSIDILHKLLNLNVQVSPHITASLPVVATIAGGPVAGFVTWVASSALSKGVQSISSYTYKVSGAWQNPEIKQVKLHERKNT